MTDKKGIEIDYGPECRGIWLDRGELEKLIEIEKNFFGNNNRHDENPSKNIDYNKYDSNKSQQSQFGYKKIIFRIFRFFGLKDIRIFKL